jgi:hypothetical protein
MGIGIHKRIPGQFVRSLQAIKYLSGKVNTTLGLGQHEHEVVPDGPLLLQTQSAHVHISGESTRSSLRLPALPQHRAQFVDGRRGGGEPMSGEKQPWRVGRRGAEAGPLQLWKKHRLRIMVQEEEEEERRRTRRRRVCPQKPSYLDIPTIPRNLTSCVSSTRSPVQNRTSSSRSIEANDRSIPRKSHDA